MCNFVELLDILVITTKSYCEKASIFSCLKKSCLGQKSSLKQLFTKHMFSCLTRSKQLNLSKKLFFLQKAKLPNTPLVVKAPFPVRPQQKESGTSVNGMGMPCTAETRLEANTWHNLVKSHCLSGVKKSHTLSSKLDMGNESELS